MKLDPEKGKEKEKADWMVEKRTNEQVMREAKWEEMNQIRGEGKQIRKATLATAFGARFDMQVMLLMEECSGKRETFIAISVGCIKEFLTKI